MNNNDKENKTGIYIDQRLSSIVRFAFKYEDLFKKIGLRRINRIVTRKYKRSRNILEIDTHGRRMLINAGNPYPYMIREHPLFNQPLVALVRDAHRRKKEKLNIIDCGAAVGDTAFLLAEKCPDCIATMHCIDGDMDFLHILRENVKRIPHDITITHAMLARSNTEIPDLVRHHPGTASATGNGKNKATTLDTLFHEGRGAGTIDVLKIDIDGYDGEALAGASALLRREHPAVIFEWHPDLIIKAGNDPFAAFDTLRDAGYKNLLAFCNTGYFSHPFHNDREIIKFWIEYLLKHQKPADPHFDIIAIPPAADECSLLNIAGMGLEKPWHLASI